MEAVLILIIIQTAGIVVFSIVICCRERAHKKKIIISDHQLLHFPGGEDWQWLIDYFQEHPDSSLKQDFPYLYNMAKATKRYKEINLLKDSGKISEKKYQNQLRKLLSLIDLRSDLTPMLPQKHS